MALRTDDLVLNVGLKTGHDGQCSDKRRHPYAHTCHPDKSGDDSEQAFAFEHVARGDKALKFHRYIVLNMKCLWVRNGFVQNWK